MRRVLSPVLTFAIVRIGLTALFVVMRRVSPASPGTEAVGVMVLFTTPALAIGFFAGLVRWRMFAAGAVRRLATDFIGPPSGARVRDLLAGAFEDPSLEIIYWAPDPGQWVDAGGKPVRLPNEGSDRAVTEVSDGGRRVAALVYDAALADPPIMSEVAGGFALVALENQRLAAELRSSLRELRDSRARILSATDQERRRIERDLHDGAQQRLVALGIKLELARELVESDPHGGAELLREIGTDVDDALGDMRSLAHGVYPSLLADYGLAQALRTAAEAGPLPSTVSAGDLGRYPEAIESAVYFCCLEALQNAAKHAEGASFVSLTFSEDDDGRLAFEVRDDGPGLAEAVTPGAGLANMRDRIAAVGGSLTIDSSPGGGTRVAGQVPLEPIERSSPDLETLLSRATDALDDCFGIFRAVRDRARRRGRLPGGVRERGGRPPPRLLPRRESREDSRPARARATWTRRRSAGIGTSSRLSDRCRQRISPTRAPSEAPAKTGVRTTLAAPPRRRPHRPELGRHHRAQAHRARPAHAVGRAQPCRRRGLPDPRLGHRHPLRQSALRPALRLRAGRARRAADLGPELGGASGGRASAAPEKSSRCSSSAVRRASRCATAARTAARSGPRHK